MDTAIPLFGGEAKVAQLHTPILLAELGRPTKEMCFFPEGGLHPPDTPISRPGHAASPRTGEPHNDRTMGPDENLKTSLGVTTRQIGAWGPPLFCKLDNIAAAGAADRVFLCRADLFERSGGSELPL